MLFLLLSTVTVPGVGFTTAIEVPSRSSVHDAPDGLVITVIDWSVPSTMLEQAVRPTRPKAASVRETRGRRRFFMYLSKMFPPKKNSKSVKFYGVVLPD